MIRRARSGADESPLSIVEIITGLNAYRDNAGKKESEPAGSRLGARQLELSVEQEIADISNADATDVAFKRRTIVKKKCAYGWEL